MTTFTVACKDKWYKDRKEESHVNFFVCRAYGNHAVNICKYLDKGCKVLVAGTMRQEQWTTDQNEHRQRILFIVETVRFLTTKNSRDRSKDDHLITETELCDEPSPKNEVIPLDTESSL
jgi:single stranded DNA-binding protein